MKKIKIKLNFLKTLLKHKNKYTLNKTLENLIKS
jgi:hypothetical protein